MAITTPPPTTEPAGVGSAAIPVDPSSPAEFVDVVGREGGYLVPVDPMDYLQCDSCQ